MTETAARTARKTKRMQDRWWWPLLVVSLFVMSIGMAPPWTVWAFEKIGAGIGVVDQANCDFLEKISGRDTCS